eukprot:Nitzschia sp. Nitz4//scaffold315_size20666//348//716//NITZ4_008639-RA/size20666-processed-gene-0.0-mRNA-1//1//CDS//3329547480//6045//frame0
MSPAKFTVTYEFSTARDAVLAVFPGADIKENRVDSYPIKVAVSADVGGQRLSVWSGRQQDLFRKYATKRAQTIATIEANLQDLKESYDI